MTILISQKAKVRMAGSSNAHFRAVDAAHRAAGHHYPPPATRQSLAHGSLRLAAIAAIALAAGCADLRWHKDGAGAAALEQDLAECRGEARIRAGPSLSALEAVSPRIVGLDATGRAVSGGHGRLDSERFLLEHDLTRICMRGKGYELVPVEKR